MWLLPNVLLNLFSLVFFIPSALKVYRSLNFIKDSVSTEIKLDRQRTMAILRLFFLVQFMSLPKILHLIVVKFDVPPQLVMISCTLYIFEGPLIFFYFVCKRETIDLIKQLFRSKEISETKRRFSETISSTVPVKSSHSYNLTEAAKISSSSLETGVWNHESSLTVSTNIRINTRLSVSAL